MNQLFIVGCPRSGTTMLQQALNRHSQIIIPPETKFFYYFYGQSARRQAQHLGRINEDLGIDLSMPNARVHRAPQARAFYHQMACRYLERLGRSENDVAWFGDKTPEHTGTLGRIAEVFPLAKIIVLWRDGRDVALSLSRMPWIDCDVDVGFVIWLYYYHVLQRWRDSQLDIYAVRYEDIVARPAQELRKVLEFLGLPYERQVAEGYGNREGIPPRELAWKGRALEPITDRYVGLWQQQLPPAVVARLERLGSKALAHLSYRLSPNGRAPLTPWFLASLALRVARCAARLPLLCLSNEAAGAARRLVGRRAACNGQGTEPHAALPATAAARHDGLGLPGDEAKAMQPNKGDWLKQPGSGARDLDR